MYKTPTFAEPQQCNRPFSTGQLSAFIIQLVTWQVLARSHLFSDPYVCTIVITNAIYSINIVYTNTCRVHNSLDPSSDRIFADTFIRGNRTDK